MKSLYLILLMLFFGLILPLNVIGTDAWTDPVAVTSSAGDDHHANVGYDFNQDQLLISWDRTEGGNTDVYAIVLDIQTYSFGPEMRVTSAEATEQSPQVVFSDMTGGGVFFQSDESGKMAIHYAEFDGDGFAEPWMVYYSDNDLYSPHSLVGGGEGVIVPWVFCCSSTGVVAGAPDMSAQMAEYRSTQGVGPVYSVAGYVRGFFDGSSFACWACEVEVSSIREIYYNYYIGNPYTGQTVTGYIPNDGYHYRRPVGMDGALFIERESDQGFDIVSTSMNGETGEWSSPTVCLPDLGDERNYSQSSVYDTRYGVYEVDYNGDWDVAFYHEDLTSPEIISPNPAEDRNPVIYFDYDSYHVFWESDRGGTWDIYYSYRGKVGVEERGEAVLPAKASLSVYPNPGNGEFRIELDSPVAGLAKADIYDVSGRLVHRIYDGWLERGSKFLFWNAADLPSGIYVLQLQGNRQIQTEKIVLLK